MIASELIKKIEEAIKEYGDIEFHIKVDDSYGYEKIEGVYSFKENEKEILSFY